jgi:hypothetical protein
MAHKPNPPAQPSNMVAQWEVPPVLPDVATEPHPTGHAPDLSSGEPSSEAGETQLQDVLPEIKRLAQKVGGFRKLAKILDTLEEMDK